MFIRKKQAHKTWNIIAQNKAKFKKLRVKILKNKYTMAQNIYEIRKVVLHFRKHSLKE